MDDFNGIEYAEHAHNAFHILGLRVKESKAQPPQRQHVLQGVDVHVQDDGVTLSPTTRRVQKLQHAIQQALTSDRLTPPEASRLAGKLAFLRQAVFGSVGRSAMQPLYARSHDTTAENDDKLSAGLRSSLKAIQHMLLNVTPRFIPFMVEERLSAVIFADAYVKVGETRHKAGHIPVDLPLPPDVRDDNGWGYVVRIGNQVLFSHGTTPRAVLNQITSRKAFIYALEIFAQLMRRSPWHNACQRLGWHLSITRPEKLHSARATARTCS